MAWLVLCIIDYDEKELLLNHNFSKIPPEGI
jgi:hypothetical protein